ncbi:MAG TPA: hypothetical protein VFQ61_27840 [Polyangiaceae bacterium]|nr:hypothetical protein [Polyangiaceae bacterium]
MDQEDEGEGVVHSDRLSPEVVLTRFQGYLTLALAVRAAQRFERIVHQIDAPIWIVDILGLTGFDPAAMAVGTGWWRSFRSRHGQEVVLISRKSVDRMAAATLGFSAGLRVKVFDSPQEAFAYLGAVMSAWPADGQAAAPAHCTSAPHLIPNSS